MLAAFSVPRAAADLLLLLLLLRGGAHKSLVRPGRKKLQRPNSRFIQHRPQEAQQTS